MEYIEKASKLIYYLAYAVLVYVLLKFGFVPLLPFIIAFLVASIAERPATRLSAKTGINKTVYSALIMLLLILVVIFSITFGAIRLYYEAKEFADELLSNDILIGKLIESKDNLSEIILNKLHVSEEVYSNLKRPVDRAVDQISEYAVEKLGEVLERIVSSIITLAPSWLLFVTITVISMFYIGCGKSIDKSLNNVLTSKGVKKLHMIRNGIISTLFKYIRSYTVMFLITFAILFIGLSVIKIKYSFMIALLVSVLDVLPVIGIGTVMIPWGIFDIIAGNPGEGFGILALFAVAVVIREVLEPRIIGKNLGMNPLLTLISMYVGFKMFGVVGIIVLPPIVTGATVYLSNKDDSSDIKRNTVLR